VKVLLFFLTTVLLCSYHLAGYSNIPEYSSGTPVAYSSIPSYSFPSNERTCVASAEPLENKINSIDPGALDTVNSEMSYENSEVPKEESSELAENSPLMMTRGPLTYNGKLKLDDDGHGLSHGDPLHKPTTSWKINGKSLNPDYDSYVVAPLWLLPQGVKAGDRADVTAYFENDVYLT